MRLIDLRIQWRIFVPCLNWPWRFQKSNLFRSKPIGSLVTVRSSKLYRARFNMEFAPVKKKSPLIITLFSYKNLHIRISIIKFLYFIIFEWRRLGCSSWTVSSAALFEFHCWGFIAEVSLLRFFFSIPNII